MEFFKRERKIYLKKKKRVTKKTKLAFKLIRGYLTMKIRNVYKLSLNKKNKGGEVSFERGPSSVTDTDGRNFI